jgi:hypothetical protein
MIKLSIDLRIIAASMGLSCLPAPATQPKGSEGKTKNKINAYIYWPR